MGEVGVENSNAQFHGKNLAQLLWHPGKGYPCLRFCHVFPQRIERQAQFSPIPVENPLCFFLITTTNSRRCRQVCNRRIPVAFWRQCNVLILWFGNGMQQWRLQDSDILGFNTTWMSIEWQIFSFKWISSLGWVHGVL